MIRKWEWVREYCKRRGFEESAEIADQIDRVLCYLYGDVDTDKWKEYMLKGVERVTEIGETNLSKEEVMTKIVGRSSFCIGCEIDADYNSDYLCGHCRFNILTGRCDEHQALYDEFCEGFKEGL